MRRATWVAAVVLALVIAYGVVATILWARDCPPSLAERHRLHYCSDVSGVIAEHRRDVRAQFHGDDMRYTYITYLGREKQIIVHSLRLCLPTIVIGELDPGDWLSQRADDAMVQESAVDDYLLALEVLELMIKRQ